MPSKKKSSKLHNAPINTHTECVDHEHSHEKEGCVATHNENHHEIVSEALPTNADMQQVVAMDGACVSASCTSPLCDGGHSKRAPREIPVALAVLPSRYGEQESSTEYYFDQYSDRTEEQKMSDLENIMQLIAADLSEPYSIFTYRYFLQSWPDLCVICRRKSDHSIIGCIVNKIEKKPNTPSVIRGYVAMLAVDVAFRFGGIGSRLVISAVELMKQKNCDLIYLETPIDNKGALRLYESLGFVRDKRLTRYYMTGSDAFRLKLWLD